MADPESTTAAAAAATVPTTASSSSAEQEEQTATPPTPAAPKTPLENDELSRRFFYGGLLGLPWLWIVHTLNWYGKKGDRNSDPPDNRKL
jgi:hypothetical protein